MRAAAAITGLGFSALSRTEIGSARDLAIDAVVAAVADAGISIGDVDGLVLTKSPSAPLSTLPLHVANDLALGPLAVLTHVEGEGTSVVQAVQWATLCIRQRMASQVVCVFADARGTGADTGAGYARAMDVTGIAGWEAAHGLYAATGAYALAAREYLAARDLGDEDLGAYAIACRRWATLNPQAFRREPLTMDAYLASPYVAEPLRVLDCAYPINGAAAVVVSAGDARGATAPPPVYVHGMGQGHAGGAGAAGPLAAGARVAAERACAMAGIALDAIDAVEMYDPFASVGLELLEAYGFCGFGRAGRLVRDGETSPGGRLPTNTGGGHLSGFYLQGMTPLCEAVIQARGHAGARQIPSPDAILVGGVGGCLEYHATLVVGPTESLT